MNHDDANESGDVASSPAPESNEKSIDLADELDFSFLVGRAPLAFFGDMK